MDLNTVHTAPHESWLFASSTLSCTRENIDTSALYFTRFVSLTRTYENIDTSQFYVARDRLKKPTSRTFAIEKCHRFELTARSVSPSSKIFLPSRFIFFFYSLADTDTIACVTIARVFQHRRRSPTPRNVQFR